MKAEYKSIIKFIIFNVIFVIAAVLLILLGLCPKLHSGFIDYADTSEVTDKIYVIIDAGHGGEDGGAQAASGLCEKDINLDIAKKLYTLLKLSDYTPVLVRDNDRLMYRAGEESRKKYYDIKNRVDFANDYPNAVFISIHQNKFPIEKYRGFQVWYSKNNESSRIYADLVQNNVKSLLQSENNRLSKQADRKIKVLDSLNMPAILAECGFLSNADEAALLAEENYRNKLAFLLYMSTVEFLEKWENYEK